MAAKTVAFILSLGHSGSTLLGHVLGSHSRAMHLGEIATPLNNGLPPTCFLCGDAPCPVWGAAVPLPALRRSWKGYRMAQRPSTRLLLPLALRLGYCEPPGHVFNLLFRAFPQTEVLIDSSKSVGWAQWNGSSRAFRIVYILLLRDLRALAATHMRLYREDIEPATQRTLGRLAAFRSFVAEQPEADRLLVRYEDLVARPADKAAELCDRLGLGYEPLMLEYHGVAHHNFGGNPGTNAVVTLHHGGNAAGMLARADAPNKGYYTLEGLHTGFRLDERWRTSLAAEQLRRFDRIGGEINRELGYGD